MLKSVDSNIPFSTRGCCVRKYRAIMMALGSSSVYNIPLFVYIIIYSSIRCYFSINFSLCEYSDAIRFVYFQFVKKAILIISRFTPTHSHPSLGKGILYSINVFISNDVKREKKSASIACISTQQSNVCFRFPCRSNASLSFLFFFTLPSLSHCHVPAFASLS